MEKHANNAHDQVIEGKVPTEEIVLEWVKRDLASAHYFLGLLLRYPDIIAEAAREIREHALKTENGSAIDHVKKEGDGNPS